MNSIFVGIHIQNNTNENLPIENINFGKNVSYLKSEIAAKLQYDPDNIELIYNGRTLEDDVTLDGLIPPNAVIHCFKKTKKYVPYVGKPGTSDSSNIDKIQDIFVVIAHIQINVNSRVNILQKILAEYPEFRRNLGAQALIRDSVLFNTLHQREVIENIAENYPLICEAAPFIVDTIKKEITRNASSTNFSEPTTDSTNSSEEENSVSVSGSSGNRNQSENARIRMISRQQLQAALALAYGSVNSLSNIAQRMSDTSSTPTTTATGGGAVSGGSVPAPLANSGSGERISSELFRNHLQRALSSLNQTSDQQQPQLMDTSEATSDSSNSVQQNTSADSTSSLDIPAYYHTHQYAEQLSTMAQMGFLNYEENLTYLNITNGNIENAINLLMGSMN